MDLVGVDRDRGNVARRAFDRLAGHGVAVIHMTIDPFTAPPGRPFTDDHTIPAVYTPKSSVPAFPDLPWP